MLLIFGGAYQGKLDYAKENEELSVFNCSADSTAIDFSKDIFNGFHLLVLAHVKNQIDTCGFIEENLGLFKNKTIICDDISCGVVPMDREERQWREAVGRSVTLLSKHADSVVRVFCGIGMRLK